MGKCFQLLYFIMLDYSYLKASTGFILEACLAGNTPEIVPTKNENNKAPIISHGEIYAFNIEKPVVDAIISTVLLKVIPITTPIDPPKIPKIPASNKNILSFIINT